MKEKLTIWAVLLQLCTGYSGLAQQIAVHSYTIEDGLVNNDVLNIRQDSQGFMWICTRGGLSRYDGVRFTNYTTGNGLTNDMINDIAEIAPQKFIVAQNLDGPRLLENDQITALRPGSKITLNRFYRTGDNRLIAASDQSGMVAWEDSVFRPLNKEYLSPVNEMAMLNDSLWAIVQTNASIQLMTGRLQPITALNILNTSVVYRDSRHRTWLGTLTGLKLLAQQQQYGRPVAFTPLPRDFDLPLLRTAWINGFLEDSNGNYWIAATGGGLIKIGANGGYTIYTEADGLPSSSINCIFEDRHKNIWAGTPLGMAKLSMGNEVKVFTQKHGLSLMGSGSVLPGGSDDLRLFDTRRIVKLSLLSNSLCPVAARDSFHYIVYRVDKDELLLVNNEKGRLYKGSNENAGRIDWPRINFYCVTRIAADYLVGGYGSRIFVVSKGKAREAIAIPGRPQISSITPAKDSTLWLTTLTMGLYKLKWHRNNDGLTLELADSIGRELPDRQIRAFFCDKANGLWIGTRYKGVIHIPDPGRRNNQVRHFGTDEGLSSNFVHSFNEDSRGNIWVGTQQGLDKLIPSGNGYRVFNFGKINNIYFRVDHIGFLTDDRLVTEGQALVHAKDLQQDTLPPPSVYTTNHPPTRLSWRQPQIYFEFCAPQSINEQWNEYRYRLLGSTDTNWAQAPASKSVYFANLKPGNYTFEVKVLGFNGRWSPPARHYFAVSTPFWQRAWFIALIIAAVAAMVYSLYRYRIRQLLRLQEVRNQIAGDLHDEIGSNLTNISILSNLGKRSLARPQQASDFLDRISEEVTASSQSLDDIIWSVNTSHDTLEETLARMRLYAAELFDGAGIGYELQLDPSFEATKLIMEQRRDIYMIYKEALNNIVKHAYAKQVLIRIAVSGRHFLLHIRDDGKGFDAGRSSDRHGLAGMMTRVKRWKGKMQVETGANKGVSLQIDLPLAG